MRGQMIPLRRSSIMSRALLGAALAVLIALRLLSPAGFMPSFDRGAVTIVACPDFDPPAMSPMGHHHHHGTKAKAHGVCPYASASTLGAADLGGFVLAAVLLAGASLLGRGSDYIAADRRHRRPPSRGPPIPA
jgi:hypothetical protein